ncbi:unnamed protein product [Moneuplotes crassus]|uniref:Uncharacterized protein n=1 Tax=Euplotes crassus TaxID=5936 RepID=A0AAD1XQX3_EUPCR|nr:unnamed protein product [Moneuplotes crassus]
MQVDAPEPKLEAPQGRLTIFSLPKNDYKKTMAQNLNKKRKDRRKEIFRAYRLKRLELESLNQYSAEEIHEKLRQEFLTGEWHQEWQLEAEEIESMSLDQILEIEEQDREQEQLEIQREVEYLQMLDEKSEIESCAYYEENATEDSPEQEFDYNRCPVCFNFITVNSDMAVCETPECIDLNIKDKLPEIDRKELINIIHDLLFEHREFEEGGDAPCCDFDPQVSLKEIIAPDLSIVVSCKNCSYIEFYET